MMNRDRIDLLRTARAVRLSIALLLIAVPSTRAASLQQVDDSVGKAVKYFYAAQRDGTWESPGGTGTADRMNPMGMHGGGLTAIATYALLAAGENPQDLRLAKALDFLKNLQTQSVYVLGVRAQIWPYLGEQQDIKRLINKDTALLLRLMKFTAPAKGLFHYPNSSPTDYDHSISQFGVLGLWAGAQNGAEVSTAAWGTIDTTWRAHQSKEGGWPYVVGGQADEGQDTLSMTCAGVATLFITNDYTHGPREALGKDENIERGMKWIADNFSRLSNPGREANATCYTLYGIERIGVAGGYKYFGSTNWFASGSDYLVQHQNPDGSWGRPDTEWGMNVHCVPDTGLSLLFLVHGRAPVVVNKLDHKNQGEKDQGLHRWRRHADR